jgi:hypothetical protein
LKLSEGHKFPTSQELQGRPYCKWHHLFTHTTNDCNELRRQIQSAIEQGQLILGQFAMKVDTPSFLGVNMVHGHRDVGERSARRRLNFSFDIQMAGLLRRRDKKEGASPCDRSRKGEREYITEEQYESEDVEYERRIGKSLKRCEDSRDHWHCPFFKYCWNSGMS